MTMSGYSPYFEEHYNAIFKAPDIKTGGAHLLDLLQQVKKEKIWGKRKDDIEMLYEQFSTHIGQYYADQEAKWLPLGGSIDTEDPGMANQRAINITRFLANVYPNSEEALIAVCSSASEKGHDKGYAEGKERGFEAGKQKGYESGYSTARPKFLKRGMLFGGLAGIALGVAATLFFTNKKDVAPSQADTKTKTEVYQKSSVQALTHN